jgi:hypothetical protein
VLAAAAEIVYASMREWPRAWWLASSFAFACGTQFSRPAPPFCSRSSTASAADRQDSDRPKTLSERAGVRVLGVRVGLGAKHVGRTPRLSGAAGPAQLVSDNTLRVLTTRSRSFYLTSWGITHRDMLAGGSSSKLRSSRRRGIVGARAQPVVASACALGRLTAGLPLWSQAGGALMLCAIPVLNLLSRHHAAARGSPWRPALSASCQPCVSLGTQNSGRRNPSASALWLTHPIRRSSSGSGCAEFSRFRRERGLRSLSYGGPPRPAAVVAPLGRA